ncbi:PilW family protein [Simiduia curdlanivorans]|uniref:PilW family protein n=1 Tax=Simiduia curdlanivorans TaxID=1492769 RepID=A0ABV8V8B8_9GAMM|nr:PilW family protein [Simiduia curdlanivorans]MDN3639510.1 PilW family protein [Simiduia curdlanivorans]
MMMRKNSGLTLVEILIAMALGITLIAGVVQIFVSNKRVFSSQQALSGIQETGRFAVELMSSDIRMAGYFGCMSRVSQLTNTLNNANGFNFDFTNAVAGADVDNDGGGAVPAGYPAALTGTDVLVLRLSTGDASAVVAVNDADSIFIDTYAVSTCAVGTGVNGLCTGDLVVVSDCSKARVFQASSFVTAGSTTSVFHASAGTPGNAIPAWGAGIDPAEVFDVGAQLMKVSTVAYYVAAGASGRPALFQAIDGVAFELFEGVENFQVSYGVDTNNDSVPDNYQNANAIAAANWQNVRSVRIALLVSSIEDNVVDEVQPFTFNGVLTTPADRRLRLVFNNTIGIRSRTP